MEIPSLGEKTSLNLLFVNVTPMKHRLLFSKMQEKVNEQLLKALIWTSISFNNSKHSFLHSMSKKHSNSCTQLKQPHHSPMFFSKSQMRRTLTLLNDEWLMKQNRKVRRYFLGVFQEHPAFLLSFWSQFFESFKLILMLLLLKLLVEFLKQLFMAVEWIQPLIVEFYKHLLKIHDIKIFQKIQHF